MNPEESMGWLGGRLARQNHIFGSRHSASFSDSRQRYCGSRVRQNPMVKLNGVTFSVSGFIGNTEGVLIRRSGVQGVSVREFQLRLEGDRLVGICDVYAKGYFELAHWVEMEKKS